jgi:N-acetylglutamate synthase-like GNAT family acetyltransferase
MDFRIRPALIEDGPAIRSLVRSALINPLGIHWSRFLIAVDGENKLVGCGQVKVHRDGSRELASIAVEPAWRRQGVASELIERLAASHEPPLYLTCRSHLETFYERFGFRVIRDVEMPPYFRRVYRLVRWFNLITGRKRSILVMRRL